MNQGREGGGKLEARFRQELPLTVLHCPRSLAHGLLVHSRALKIG